VVTDVAGGFILRGVMLRPSHQRRGRGWYPRPLVLHAMAWTTFGPLPPLANVMVTALGVHAHHAAVWS